MNSNFKFWSDPNNRKPYQALLYLAEQNRYCTREEISQSLEIPDINAGFGLKQRGFVQADNDFGPFRINQAGLNELKRIIDTYNWTSTNQRFICFIDIMGFKDIVSRNDHNELRKKLFQLTHYHKMHGSNQFYLDKDVKADNPRTNIRSYAFSDTIVIITQDVSPDNLAYLSLISMLILTRSFQLMIPVKGVISKGLLTAEEIENGLLIVGQPLISAAELYNQFEYYGIVIHESVEDDLASFKDVLNMNMYPVLEIPIKESERSKLNKTAFHNISLSSHLFIDADKTLEKLYSITPEKKQYYVTNTIEMLNRMRNYE